MFTFLLVLQGIVAAALIGTILMQKSEGGGLGVGGSPAGFLSARGAADFLTRATAVLATAFVGLSIVLAVIASVNHRSTTIDAETAKGGAATTPALPETPGPGSAANTPVGPAAPTNPDDPLAGAAAAVGGAEADKGANAPRPQGVPIQE
jgi:preprotein translocase subunit SecG